MSLSQFSMTKCLKCEWSFWAQGLEALCGTCSRELSWSPRTPESDLIDETVRGYQAHERARVVESAELPSGLVVSGAPVPAKDMEAGGGGRRPQAHYGGSAEPMIDDHKTQQRREDQASFEEWRDSDR